MVIVIFLRIREVGRPAKTKENPGAKGLGIPLRKRKDERTRAGGLRRDPLSPEGENQHFNRIKNGVHLARLPNA